MVEYAYGPYKDIVNTNIVGYHIELSIRPYVCVILIILLLIILHALVSLFFGSPFSQKVRNRSV